MQTNEQRPKKKTKSLVDGPSTNFTAVMQSCARTVVLSNQTFIMIKKKKANVGTENQAKKTIEIIHLYRCHCDGAGFAMPPPDITSVEHHPTRPEKDQKRR